VNVSKKKEKKNKGRAEKRRGERRATRVEFTRACSHARTKCIRTRACTWAALSQPAMWKPLFTSLYDVNPLARNRTFRHAQKACEYMLIIAAELAALAMHTRASSMLIAPYSLVSERAFQTRQCECARICFIPWLHLVSIIPSPTSVAVVIRRIPQDAERFRRERSETIWPRRSLTRNQRGLFDFNKVLPLYDLRIWSIIPPLLDCRLLSSQRLSVGSFGRTL